MNITVPMVLPRIYDSGLWALEENREEVMRKFDIQTKEAKDDECFTHGYYQGLIIEIGFDVAKKEKSRNISKKLLDFYFKILPFWKTKQ